MTWSRGKESTDSHIPALDGLRALAVIGVLAFHDNRLSGGFLGVDLFFVLSGFLITGLLIERLHNGDLSSLSTFWTQRLRRLMPSVLIVIVTVLLVFRLAGEPSEWIPARRDAPWAQFYGANWHQIWLGTDYWSQYASPSPFEHLWSLAIEEQFYLLWPIILFALVRAKRLTTLPTIAGVGAIISALAMWILSFDASVTRVYMGTDTRAFSLLIGAFLATPTISTRARDVVQRYATAFILISAAFIVGLGAMWFSVDGNDDGFFRGPLQLHSLAAGVLIVIVAHSTSPVTRILASTPLTAIGRLSYALYLWHWPVDIFVSTQRTGWDDLTVSGVRLAVTFALSIASYALIENPIRFRLHWTRGRRGLGTFVAATVVTSAVWLAMPIPSSTNAVDADALAAAMAAPSIIAPTTTPTANEPVDVVPNWTDLRLSTAYYLGDSIASDIWPALQAAFTAAGIRIESGAFGGAGLVASRDNMDPLATLARTLDELSPDLLIVQLSVWDGDQPSEQINALRSLHELAIDHDTHIVFISFPSLSAERLQPGQTLLEIRARDLAAASQGRIAYLDQQPALGKEFAFDLDGDGIPERKPDGVHVCPTGALIVTRWLMRELSTFVPSIQVPTDDVWAFGDWTTDERYESPPGACARR